MASVYISCGGAGKSMARQLAMTLRGFFISVYYPSETLTNDYYQKELASREIASCEMVVFLLDKMALTTRSVQHEISCAYQSNKRMIVGKLYKHLSFSATAERHLASCELVDVSSLSASSGVVTLADRILSALGVSGNGNETSEVNRVASSTAAAAKEVPAVQTELERYIFVSYAHKDAEAVMPVVRMLRARGYRLWLDEGIRPGADWDDYIADKIENCGYMMSFISQAYIDSDNCRDELNYARDLKKKRLLVYLEDVALTGGMAMRLNRLQAIHMYRYDSMDKLIDKLVSAEGIQEFRN